MGLVPCHVTLMRPAHYTMARPLGERTGLYNPGSCLLLIQVYLSVAILITLLRSLKLTTVRLIPPGGMS